MDTSVARRMEDEDAAHVLPRWFVWVQANLFLTALILAEAYLLGTLMAYGWVANIEDPSHWGVYHGIGVVLFFSAGAMAAGIALQCSIKAAACFSRHEWGFAFFNFSGVVAFALAEIWTSLSERSANLRPTPADSAVLALLGHPALPISPTVVIVAFLLPFTTIYYGFAQQKPGVRDAEAVLEEARKKAAAIEAEQIIRTANARKNAAVRAEQAKGVRGTLNAALGIETPQDEPPPDGGPGRGLAVVGSADGGAAETQLLPLFDEEQLRAMRNAQEREQAVAEVQRRVRRSGGRVRASDLQTILDIGDSRARDIVKGACGGVADESGHYTAPVGEVVRYLRRAGTATSTTQATKVWDALGPRKKARSNSDSERGLPAPDSQPLPLPVRTLQRDSDEDDGAEDARVLAFSGRGASR